MTGTGPNPVQTFVAPELDVWDRWNYARTEALIDTVSARYVPAGLSGVDDLDQHGAWRVVPEYGSVWVPQGVATDWAPYTTGRWVWDPRFGWSWVDTAPWGWAPYHYGRWVHLDRVWAWAPGPVIVRPVYAPALVAFFGAPGVRVAIGAPFVSWVALGWGEPCVPWWGRPGFVGRAWWGGWGGPRVVNNVVVNRTTVVNVRNITVYRNVGVQNAVVAVRPDRFGRGPVGDGPHPPGGHAAARAGPRGRRPSPGSGELRGGQRPRRPSAGERAGAPDGGHARTGDARPAARGRGPRTGAAHRAGPARGGARRGERAPAVRGEPAGARAPASGPALRHQPPAGRDAGHAGHTASRAPSGRRPGRRAGAWAGQPPNGRTAGRGGAARSRAEPRAPAPAPAEAPRAPQVQTPRPQPQAPRPSEVQRGAEPPARAPEAAAPRRAPDAARPRPEGPGARGAEPRPAAPTPRAETPRQAPPRALPGEPANRLYPGGRVERPSSRGPETRPQARPRPAPEHNAGRKGGAAREAR